MANPINPMMKTGTLGELLVQIRLLEHDVQAAPPLKDTGNDLIALKGSVCRAIQVKTKTTGDDPFDAVDGLDRNFDILALVNLRGEGEEIHLDRCEVYFVWRTDGFKTYYSLKELRDRGFTMTKTRVSDLFSPQKVGGIISARQVAP
jgi:hypothetical protein